MENNKLCKLCYISDKQIIKIFDDEGNETNIVKIIKKHFWFKLFEKDFTSNVICSDCWLKTEDFHKFYNNVKNAHNNYIKTIITRELIANNQLEKNLIYENKENDQKNLNVTAIDIVTIKIEDNEGNKDTTSSIGSIDNIKDENIIIESNVPSFVEEDNENENSYQPTTTNDDSDFNYCNDDNDDVEDDNSDYDDKKKKFSKSKKRKRKSKVMNSMPKRKCKKGTNPSSKKKTVVKEIENAKERITPTICNDKDTLLTSEDLITKKLHIEKEDAQIREYFKMACEICNFKFITFLDAKAHYREQHKIKGYLVCCSQRKYYHRGHVIEHILRHLNPEAYKCEFCNKSYANKTALRNHIAIHASPEDRPYKCDICPKSFSKLGHLSHHKKYRHCTEEDKKFSCDVCSKSFMSKSILTSHIRGVHENAYVQICDVCAKVFKSKKILESHRALHFASDMKPRLQCSICGSWLKHESSLRAHLARHKDTTHKCPKCGKVTPSRDSLQNHIRYVHAERKYNCTLCEKAFKKPIGLREHMASHTGEILYTCPHCPKTFNSGANMHSHRKKIHPIEWHENRGLRNSSIQNCL